MSSSLESGRRSPKVAPRARSGWRALGAMVLAGLLTLLGAVAPTRALDPNKPFADYPLMHWTPADGLPTASVYAITQDRQGYLWISWTTGLARFDGLRFENFSRRQLGLLGTDIRDAFCDSGGRLWFSSIHGLLLRDGDRFVAVEGSPETGVSGVIELDDGTVLAATAEGVMRYEQGRLVRHDEDNFSARSIARTRDGYALGGVGFVQLFNARGKHLIALPSSYASTRVEHIATDGDVLWLGTSLGLLRLRDGKIEPAGLQDANEPFGPGNPNLDSTHIVTLHSDRQGNLWISTAARLFRRTAAGKLERIEAEALARTPYVLSMFEDRQGNLWLGSRYYGLFGLWDGWTKRIDDRSGLPDSIVWSLARDPVGGILLGTNSSVIRAIDGKLLTRVDPLALRGRTAFELAFDRDSNLWVGTRAGVAVFDKFREITPPTLSVLDQTQIFAIVGQPDGAMWLGTGNGLYRYADGEVLAMSERFKAATDLNLRSILVLDNDDLLIGSTSGIWHLHDGTWGEPAWAAPLHDANISSFTRVSPQLLVIATRDAGLGLVSGDKLMMLTTEQGLPTDNAWHTQVHGEYLYVATNEGVWRTLLANLPDPRATTTTSIHAEQILPREDCCVSGGFARAATDDTGIWFTGTRGAIHIDTASIVTPNASEAFTLIEGIRHDGKLLGGTQSVVLDDGSRDIEVQFTSIEFRDPNGLRFRYQLEGYDKDWRIAENHRGVTYTNLPPGNFRFKVQVLDGRNGVGNQAQVALTVVPRWYERSGVRFALILAVFALVALAQLWMRHLYNLRRVALQRLIDERAAELTVTNGRLQSTNEQLRSEIAERLAAERELQNRNHDLQAVNMQLENAQNQLLQSEKMASVGQLAAGVAHEINNPIGFVQSNLNSMREYVNDLFTILDAFGERLDAAQREAIAAEFRRIDLPYLREDLPVLLDQSLDGVSRVIKIVRDLKDFSYVDRPEWQTANLHDCIESTLNLVNHELKYKATVVREYDALPAITCMPFQLNQVIMNLLINAAQAIADRGVITIRTIAEAESVRLEISDTGKGIPREQLNRIFEPFFTTKPIGKGTGLGLSVSYGIVRKHGGTIEVSSTEGKGTTFVIRLPHVPPHARGERDAADDAASGRMASKSTLH